MRILKTDSSFSKQIKRQIFFMLSAAPLIMLILIGFIFYKIYLLENIVSDDSIPRKEIIFIINSLNIEFFVAGFICVIGLLFQIFLLTQLVLKIFPKDLESKINNSDKEIISRAEVKNFDAINNDDKQKVEDKSERLND